MGNEGFINIHRKILEWEWYTDVNTKVLFLHCLLRANYKEAKWQGITIERGSFVTSIRHLADETGLTIQQTRTALEHLTSTHEITQRKTSKYTMITVVSYSKYQFANTENNTQPSHKQHTKQHSKNTLVTTREKKKKSISIPYGDRDTENPKNPAAPAAAGSGEGLPGVPGAPPGLYLFWFVLLHSVNQPVTSFSVMREPSELTYFHFSVTGLVEVIDS